MSQDEKNVWGPGFCALLYLLVHFIPDFGGADVMGSQWLYVSLVDFVILSFILVKHQQYKNGMAIPGATDFKFKPTENAQYTVTTVQNGCTSQKGTSYFYLVTDIVNLEDNQFIKVTPNPYSSNVYLHFFLIRYNSLNVDVLDFATGRPIANRVKQPTGSNLNLQSLSTGVYIIKVYSSDMKFVHMFKIVKL